MGLKVQFFLLVIVGISLAGCITIQPVGAGGGIYAEDSSTSNETNGSAAGRENSPAERSSTLKPLDPIYIRFSGILDQNGLDIVIDEKGEISLLHLSSPIQASGLSTSQLENLIEKRYLDEGIYRNVSVNVTMTAKLYYVQGEVRAPGRLQLANGTTLLQAIAGAGGYTPYADKKKVQIIRDGRILGTFNMKKIEKNPSLDVKIDSGDMVKVPQSWY